MPSEINALSASADSGSAAHARSTRWSRNDYIIDMLVRRLDLLQPRHQLAKDNSRRAIWRCCFPTNRPASVPARHRELHRQITVTEETTDRHTASGAGGPVRDSEGIRPRRPGGR